MPTFHRYFLSLLLMFAMGSACVSAADAPRASGASAAPTVTLKTNKGDIVLELYPDKAPKTVANFLKYVEDGHYNGTIFHRVIDGFMIQGGGFDKDLQEKETRPPIENEARNGLKNTRYSIAMARTANPNSATAQFYINVNDNAGLDYPAPDNHGYCVFGKVIGGMEAVDKIKLVQTEAKGPAFRNLPVEPVIIESATTAK